MSARALEVSGGVRRAVDSRPLLWLILAVPGAVLLFGWISDAFTYGRVVTDTGHWAAWLLMFTLAVTPLRLIFKRGAWLVWLVRRRRNFGVASFAYAVAHTLVYVFKKQDLLLIVQEAAEPWLWAGWLALLAFIPLAVTSTDAAVRALRQWWKPLHRLVYVAAVLVFVHWTLSAFDPLIAYLNIAVLAALETVRVGLQLSRRASRRSR